MTRMKLFSSPPGHKSKKHKLSLKLCFASIMSEMRDCTSPRAERKTDVFRFTDLPGELRDWVYDMVDSDTQRVAESYVEHSTEQTDAAGELQHLQMPYFFVQQPPRTNLMAMNKQFGAEYHQRAVKMTKIIVVDHMDFQFATYDPNDTLFFDYASSVKKLELHMVASCPGLCNDRHSRCDILRLGDFLATTTPKYPAVNEVELKLGLWGDWSRQWPAFPHSADIRRSMANAKITSALYLKRIEVYQIPMGFEDFQDFFIPKNLFATWTPGRKWKPTPLAFPELPNQSPKSSTQAPTAPQTVASHSGGQAVAGGSNMQVPVTQSQMAGQTGGSSGLPSAPPGQLFQSLLASTANIAQQAQATSSAHPSASSRFS